MGRMTNTIRTPFGTFTRKSGTAYAFAAVAEAATNPELGLPVVGNRKGDGLARVRYAGSNPCPAVRYHIVWSRTEAGARKNAEGYVWFPARCVGVFPVEIS
jgi:hypothetical protein